MKLLEYMAMERATVAPRSRNIEDLIDHTVNGLLFEPDSEESLAHALRRLALDEKLRHQLGGQARLKVLRLRNWSRNAEVVERAMAEAAGSPRVSLSEQLPSGTPRS
jgi:glycosyltransferase involved in cell wall biosynthesis